MFVLNVCAMAYESYKGRASSKSFGSPRNFWIRTPRVSSDSTGFCYIREGLSGKLENRSHILDDQTSSAGTQALDSVTFKSSDFDVLISGIFQRLARVLALKPLA